MKHREGAPSVCDCIIYPLSLLYAAINSVYTPGKVFPKHRRAWLPAYPLSILLCPDIVHLPTPTPIPRTPFHHASPSPPHSFIPPFALPPPPSTNSIFHPAIKFHSISVPLVPWSVHRRRRFFLFSFFLFFSRWRTPRISGRRIEIIYDS